MHYVFFILVYSFTSYALYRVAVKLEQPRAWLAAIPFAREWLLVQMTERSWKWFVALLVPVVNIVVAFMVWGEIAQKLNRSVWLGRAMIVPIVNIALLAALAFNITWHDIGKFIQRLYRTVSRRMKKQKLEPAVVV